MRPVYLFDDGCETLAPLTDLRPAFDVRTGAMTLLERFGGMRGVRLGGLLVPEALAPLTRERHSLPVNEPPAGDDAVLVVNGRVGASHDPGFWQIEPGDVFVEPDGETVVVACVGPRDVARVIRGEIAGLRTYPYRDQQLLSRPWHVRTFRDRNIYSDLCAMVAERTGRTSIDVGQAPEFEAVIDRTAKVHSSAILDAERGYIVIAEGAVVRPGAIIVGPAYVGPHSTVLEHALIKANTAIGPWCKVGGEVGGTIFQGYANKAHEGHLGDSWVGEWVNLGAGTTNSNLLNTYGEVIAKAAPNGSNERTGETFLGATLGDHAKTAICTRVMAGAIVGTGTMWAASSPITGCVPAFTWATDEGRRSYRFDKFMDVAKAAMARRGVEPTAAYDERLRGVHAAHHPKASEDAR